MPEVSSPTPAGGAAPTAAPTPAAPPAAAPPKPAGQEQPPGGQEAKPVEEQKFKVKVDGKEEEVPLSELQKHFGTFKASQKSMQEAASLRAQAEEALSHIKKGTRDALRAAGLSDQQIRDIAVETLAEEHQKLLEEERRNQLSPEQRELEEARKRLADADKERERVTAEKRAADVSVAKQRLGNAVINTLEQFPENIRRDETLAWMALNAWGYAIEHPDEAQKLDVEWTPKGVARAIAKRHRGLARELMAHAKDEELDDFIPPTVKGRLFKSAKGEAEAAAHPALTSQGASRSQNGAEHPVPTISRNKKIRELTLGGAHAKK